MSWSEALWKYCIKPQDFPKDVVKWNESFVAINDGYPKSEIHILVLPRVKIDGIKLLAPDHVQLLKDMKSFAFQTISDMDLDDKNLKMGFHAIPSMKQLHMHVISMDLEGKGLKKKHHYNSFVTEFFLDIDAIIDKLKSGKLKVIIYLSNIVG